METPLNILLLTDRFELRGSSVYTLRLARNLVGHGICPQILCSDASRLDLAQRSGLPLREQRHLAFPILNRLALEWIAREMAAAPPDLIHIQSRSVLSQGQFLARRWKRPYALTVHDFLTARATLSVDRQWCRRIIAVSKAVQSDLLSRGDIPDELVTVIHPGIEPIADPRARPVLDPAHVPVIGTAGPLEAVKGLPFFLGAAQQVLAVRPNVEFLVAGAGPEEQNLRRLTRELRVAEHVTFVPNMFDFAHALTAMDIFCLPSLRQGLGLIMIEAMGMGKPVIATGVGGVYSVIKNNVTGFVVPAADSEQLAQRMLQLLDDPVKARAIGEAGRASVLQEFSVERMIQQTVDVYQQAVRLTAPVSSN